MLSEKFLSFLLKVCLAEYVIEAWGDQGALIARSYLIGAVFLAAKQLNPPPLLCLM